MTENSLSCVLDLISSGQLALPQLIDVASRFGGEGEITSARELYRAWIDQNPSHPQLYVACFNCAALDTQAQDHSAAMKFLNQAIALNPDFVPAYINLGRTHEELGAIDRAVELWQLAAGRNVPINGLSVQYAITALTQIARVFSAAQQCEGAEDAIFRCLELDPNQFDIIEQYTALRLAQCKWPIAIASAHLDRKKLLRGINPLSMSAYTDDPFLQLASAYHYVKRSAWDGPHTPESDRRHAPIELGDRRPRIGYISSDLRDHAIGYLMAELFELHDKQNVEVFAYYCGPKSNSALTNRIKSAAEHWIDIRDLDDNAAARQIAKDGIDILVDVNGHTRDSRTGVFARRPAPIQVNWLGYPGSMGSPYHQYIIADDWIIPREFEIYYSEKVVRLPCYQPNDRKRIIATERPTRDSAGLPEDAFIFCCFNGTHKISRFTFERWLEILGQVPDSALWLLDANEQTKQRLRQIAELKGISQSRVIFAPKMPNPHHLARYPLADLFLDSVPYGAHTTASDALWMGVPVLTLSGRSFASRVCGSLVRAAGLDDLVCTMPDEYVARAVALAGNRAELEAYKAKLRETRDTCLLFDTGKLVGKLESLYRSMCDDYRNGSVPQPDLTNLEFYLEAGMDHDHDSEEVLRISNYNEFYKEKLKRLHLARPLAADGRLWRQEDILAADMAPPGQISSNNAQLSLVRNLARSLHAAGHTGSAILLLKELAHSHPKDIETLRQLAGILNASGKTLECLELLQVIRGLGAHWELLLDDVRAVIAPAIQCFNDLIAAGNIGTAVNYVDALANLLPGNVAAVTSALSCNIALERTSRAGSLATMLLEIDPHNKAARKVLAANSDAVKSVLPFVQDAVHPLIKLRDLYDEVSSILCSTLTEQSADKIRQLLAAANKLEVRLPEGSELAGWEKHYRLAVRAIDLSATVGPAPGGAEEANVVLATASGKKLDWKGLQAASVALGAEAVFFAAADRAYIDVYGAVYINSILENSDVSSLIVLHVIGGADDLREIAKSIGLSSKRFFLSGDTFDAAAITTRCYDAPPKGLSLLPIAHLQSVRFLRVGSLLRCLNLPLFVSDIDLILQRGVKDLLEKFEGHDLVLNENTQSSNAGSRFTANLLLLNPTENAATFLQFLGHYLKKSLGGDEVTRWIDQFGIILARHHLLFHQSDARIGYFDVNADINNLIYPNFRENSYRFFSLYHGFDMSTLPISSRSRRMAPSGRKKTSASAQERPRRARSVGTNV
jgi:predicted O-linked N-acetylglucosamine transferase (SPINDLY family)